MSTKDEFFDVIRMLGEEAVAKVDELGYSFLESIGYRADKARRYPKAREKLLRALKCDNAELRPKMWVDRESGTISFWYTFFKSGKQVCESTRIEFVFGEPEGGEEMTYER